MAQFTLPDLPYDPAALEPHIDQETMRIHHGKHHQTYVTNLNNALAQHPDFAAPSDIDQLIRRMDQVPEPIRNVVRNNGGGHANHSLFWQIMGPNGGGEPTGAVGDAIRSAFGDYASFRDQLKQAGVTRFGSGWAWLISDGGTLKITSTPNQDSPLMEGKTPILGVDVWEHSYYLRYQNRRPDYLDAWFNTINWDAVNQRLAASR